MRQIQVVKPGKIVLIDSESRALQPDEVRVQIKASGICGSDIHVFEGSNSMACYPVVLGHEAAGVILEIGSDVSHCKQGDHVVLEPLVSCGLCYACRKGRPNACSSMQARGCHIDGFFSEEVIINAKSVFPIDNHIPWEDAALVEPYTIAAQAAFRSRAEEGDFVLILGAGTMGITMVDMFKLLNCYCAIVDIDKSRLKMAQEHFADEVLLSDKEELWVEEFQHRHNSNPPNIIIEATGVPKLLTLALNLVSSGGRIVNLGFSKSSAAISPLELSRKEVDLLGSRHQTFQFQKVINLVCTKKIIPQSMISQKVRFTDAVDVFAEISAAHKKGKNLGKILLEWDHFMTP